MKGNMVLQQRCQVACRLDTLQVGPAHCSLLDVLNIFEAMLQVCFGFLLCHPGSGCRLWMPGGQRLKFAAQLTDCSTDINETILLPAIVRLYA